MIKKYFTIFLLFSIYNISIIEKYFIIIKKYFTIVLLFSIYNISIIEKYFVIIKTL